MRPSTLFLALSTTAVTLAADVDPIPGYKIVDIAWEIEVSPGRIEILNGTVQEVVAQAIAINPDYKLRDVPPEPAPAFKPRGRLQGREVKFCNNFGTAGVNDIIAGVDYLRGVSGQPSMGPGPGACGRVSCSYNSAIYWCNDNTVTKTVTWDGIANSAKHITEVCPWYLAPNNRNYVSGQNFELGSWNTLVKEDRC